MENFIGFFTHGGGVCVYLRACQGSEREFMSVQCTEANAEKPQDYLDLPSKCIGVEVPSQVEIALKGPQ